MRDDLVKSIRSLNFDLEPSVVDQFVDFTNGYINDMTKLHEHAEKVCGKTLADEEIDNGFLKKFKNYVEIVRKMVDSGMVSIEDADGSPCGIKKIDKYLLTKALDAVKCELGEYQNDAFHIAENRARSKGISPVNRYLEDPPEILFFVDEEKARLKGKSPDKIHYLN